jgi:hypothetical protein
MIHRWFETPPLPFLFYAMGGGGVRSKTRVGYCLTQPGLYLYFPILQDLFTGYLLNRLCNGPPGLNL